MEGALSQMKKILIIFPKKFCLEQMDNLGPKMAHPHNSGPAASKNFFLTLRNKKGEQVNQSNDDLY